MDSDTNQRFLEGGEIMATIGTKKVDTLNIAYMTYTGPYAQIGPLFGTLYEWLQKKGAIVKGTPMMGVYYDDPNKTPAAKCRAEICYPVSGHLTPEGNVAFKELPATDVVYMTHKGPYQKIGNTYNQVFNWILNNRYQVTGPCREVYLNSPDQTKPEDLLTEIQVPVTKGQSTTPSCGCSGTK